MNRAVLACHFLLSEMAVVKPTGCIIDEMLVLRRQFLSLNLKMTTAVELYHPADNILIVFYLRHISAIE